MLAAALDSCAEGRPRALYVEGAAGTGKSTVLAEAQADAHLRGWTVLTGRSSILEAANDLGVLRQLLDALPPLPDVSPAAVLGQVPVDSSPFAVFECVSAHLLDVAARGPVLITVDDLHWCDASSLRLLAYLANRNTDQPVALVLAGSPGELSGHRFMLDELVASCERQKLGRLTRSLLCQWVADVLGGPPDDAFVAGCLEATGGNVTLLAELLPALAAHAQSLAVASDGVLRLDCDRLEIQAPGGTSLRTGSLEQEIAGDLRTRAGGVIESEAHAQRMHARRGDVALSANDDVTLDGERVRLNSPREATPVRPGAPLPLAAVLGPAVDHSGRPDRPARERPPSRKRSTRGA